MSFGFSINDVALLVKLAWNVVQNTRRACGEHDELTHEVSQLHIVFCKIAQELEDPQSPINHPGGTWRKELEKMVDNSGDVLQTLHHILVQYLGLNEGERDVGKLWKRARFGNGQVPDLGQMRDKITFHTSAITLYLNLISSASLGRVEKKMDEAGGDVKAIKSAVNNMVAAQLMSRNTNEDSIFTAHSGDDKTVWRAFRRDLINQGYRSSFIHEHQSTIKAYIEELGNRGVLDEKSDEHLSPQKEPRSKNFAWSQASSIWDVTSCESLTDPCWGPDDDEIAIQLCWGRPKSNLSIFFSSLWKSHLHAFPSRPSRSHPDSKRHGRRLRSKSLRKESFDQSPRIPRHSNIDPRLPQRQSNSLRHGVYHRRAGTSLTSLPSDVGGSSHSGDSWLSTGSSFGDRHRFRRQWKKFVNDKWPRKTKSIVSGPNKCEYFEYPPDEDGNPGPTLIACS